MLPDRVSNPGPMTYESGALPIGLRGPAEELMSVFYENSYWLVTSLSLGVNILRLNDYGAGRCYG